MWVFVFQGKNTPPDYQSHEEHTFSHSASRCAEVRFVELRYLRDAYCDFTSEEGGHCMKATKKAKPSIIATRKSCNPNGTGLSHYVMMDSKK